MDIPITNHRSVNGREPIASEIRAVREYVKGHGGMKKVETQAAAISALVGLPVGFEGSRYIEVLRANFAQINALIEYAQAHGGLKKLQTDIAAVIELAALTGGSLEKARQALDLLKEFK